MMDARALTEWEARKLDDIRGLSAEAVIGWHKMVTGHYGTGRNWIYGEKAALTERANFLKIKIKGLNA